MQRVATRSLALLLLAACGGGLLTGQQAPPDGGTTGTPTSFVVWPVAQGAVTVFELDATGVRGKAIGSTTTDASGGFDLHLAAPSTLPLLLVVSSGSFTEPATGTTVRVDGNELTAQVPPKVRVSGDALAGVLVSPLSHLSARLASYYVNGGHQTVDDALTQAAALLDSHFGGLTWRTLAPPPDLTDVSSAGLVQLNDQSKAALLLAALSQEAKNLATAKGLTPGGPLNSLTLLAALAEDLAADGYFDGSGAGGGRIVVPAGSPNGYALDGQTVRSALAQGITTFLGSPRNQSHIATADAQGLVTLVGTDSNPKLFRGGAGPLDLTPPTITFVQPAPNTALQGTVTIEAVATDDVAAATFTFTAPAALANLQATSEAGGKALRLKGVLDVGALADGQLTISAQATDSSANTATGSLVVRVANHGPTINLTGVTEGAVVSGTVSIGATASSQSGAAVTKLQLQGALPGAGSDKLPASEQLLITWDTTQAPEGAATFVLHAEDATGATTDKTVRVVVDNVPLGVLNVTAWAGAPLKGATIQVFALDPLTGEVASSTGHNGLLGAAGPTDAKGLCKVTLSAENYVGPVQVVASGGTMTYTDPSDGSTTISFPSSAQLTSILGSYRTGEVATLSLSLWTTLADAEALAYAQGKHRSAPTKHSLAEALAFADPLFSRHVIATPTWTLRTTAPASLTAGPQTLADGVYAAIPDVALNQLARDLSVKAGVTPGSVITAPSLLQLFLQDLAADGQLDGKGQGGAQLQTAGSPAQALDANTLRFYLAIGLNGFAQGLQNKTGLLPRDFQNAGIYSSLVNDSSPLFGSLAPLPFSPPTINWVTPSASGAGVQGRVQLTVTAASTNHLSSFAFTAPAALANTAPLFLSDRTGATLSTAWDVGALPDGDITLTVAAVDQFSNATTQNLVVHVANHGPDLSITSLSEGATVKGTINLNASASPHAGDVVTKLVVQSVLQGLSPDQLPAADQLLQSWDTTRAPEGLTAVTFYAEDNYGASTTKTVTVQVDNVGPGVIHVALSAGAPIAGATCQAVALNNATGQVDTSVGPSLGVLGAGAPTDAAGTTKLTLGVENYAGPVQVSCGGSALTYADPSDGTTSIGVPNTFRFTSVLGHFAPGQEVTVPLTLWTTLGDVELLAYAQGAHRTAPVAHTVAESAAFADPLLSRHIGASSASTWDLRATVPVSLTAAQQSLRDVVYAAIPDVALNRLARDLANRAGVGAGQISAISLAQLFAQDLAADGQFDGKGQGGAQLSTIGHPAQNLDANTLRFQLAYALDEFVQGPTNQTGLTRAGVQAAGVYDHIADDTSALFGAQAPLPFDNAPPTVTFAASYDAPDGTTGNAPVGAGALVSGTLRLVVTASDPSGVASLAVAQGATPLSPAAGSTPPGRLVFAIDTTQLPNGPLSFVATAADAYGTAGTTPFSVTVANAPPQVTYAAANFASGAYYGGSVPVDASAVDANGIASFTITGLLAFTNQSGVLTRISGTWSPPAGQADGVVTATFSTCNLVHVCASSSRSFSLDRAPPTLTFVAQPPSSTSSTTLTLQVRASDGGSGVAGVLAQNGNQTAVTAPAPVAGVYTLSVPLPLASDGQTQNLAVWAVDQVGNSSKGLSGQLTFGVVLDVAGPTITADSTRSVYRDESGITIQTSAPGVPVMPAQYNLPVTSGVFTSIVHKAATRLGWAQQGLAAPGPQDLLGANPNNWPFLAFLVDSPSGLGSVTYSVTIDDSTTAYTGALLPAGNKTYLLPLTADAIPGLLTLAPLARPVSLNVVLQAVSASGVSKSSSVQQNFQVVGPALAWVEDSAISAASFEAGSTYQHRLWDGTYASMFSGTTPVKLVRYLVRNPSTLPVALKVTGSGTWAASETWGIHAGPVPSYLANPYVAPDGGTLPNPLVVDSGPADACGHGGPIRCGAQQYASHAADLGQQVYLCVPKPALTTQLLGTQSDASAATTLPVYANPQTNGGETAAPASTNDGFLVVPGASGNQPGSVVIYVARPAAPTRTTPLVYQDLDSDSGSQPRYQLWVADFWPTRTTAFTFCGYDEFSNAMYFDTYATQRAVKFLSSAQDSVVGSFSLTTVGLNPGGTATIGATTTVASNVSFNRTISH